MAKTKGRKIRVKQGLKKDLLLITLSEGEFGWCTDTKELYIGSSIGNQKVNSDVALRVDDGKLQFHDGADWKEVQGSGGLSGGGTEFKYHEFNIQATTLNQTEFDIPLITYSSTKDVLLVFRNGVKVATDDYTATNTKVVLKLPVVDFANTTITMFIFKGSIVSDEDLYKLPVATTTTLGGIKPDGTTFVVDSNGVAKSLGGVIVEDTLKSTSRTNALSAFQGNMLQYYINDVEKKTNYGLFAYSDGEASFSTGRHVYATGDSSFATGSDAKALGSASFAEGASTKATGDYSHAGGMRTNANGDHSFAMGYATSTWGKASCTIGSHSSANGDYSLATGANNIANDFASHASGYYSKYMSGTSDAFRNTNTAYTIGNGTPSTGANAFRVMFNGATYGQGAFNTTGADYAEYFEWEDSNSNNEDRVGYFVTLDGEKIRKANSSDDYILGVVSANPSVIGNSYQDQWSGMYVTDEWGRIENHYVDIPAILDEKGNEIIPARQDYVHKLNTNYNNESEYIPRESRKEWSPVGMLGQLLVRDDGTCVVNGYCKSNDDGIATSSPTGYRVMKRINDNIVQVLVK